MDGESDSCVATSDLLLWVKAKSWENCRDLRLERLGEVERRTKPAGMMAIDFAVLMPFSEGQDRV